MLGDDDIGLLIDEPISAADLFGEDEGEIPPIPPGSPSAGDGGDNPLTDAPADGAAPDAAASAKKRRINRLANLNERWVTDPKQEGIFSVNKYFEDIKLKPGKGDELKILKTVLKRYEYWAQQCYPKYCFKDVINKMEYLSGKKPIRNALTSIRNNTNPFENIIDGDNAEGNDMGLNGIGVNLDNDMGLNDNLDDGAGASVFPPIVNDVPSTPTQHSFDSFAAPTQPVTASASTPITEELKEIISRKREAAIAKRKRKIEESMNTSASSSVSQAGGGEASLNISSITIPECGATAKNSENEDLEASLNYSLTSVKEIDHEGVMNEESPLNSTSLSTQPCPQDCRKDVDQDCLMNSTSTPSCSIENQVQTNDETLSSEDKEVADTSAAQDKNTTLTEGKDDGDSQHLNRDTGYLEYSDHNPEEQIGVEEHAQL